MDPLAIIKLIVENNPIILTLENNDGFTPTNQAKANEIFQFVQNC